jgi:hypothetical protein
MFKNFRKKQPAQQPEFDLTGLVGKYQEMDPETETFIRSSALLKDEMIVLVETEYRKDLNDIEFEADLFIARRRNRWVKVTNFDRRQPEIVRFVGVYEDGTMANLQYHRSIGWIVKKDSVNKAYKVEQEARRSLRADRREEMGKKPVAVKPTEDLRGQEVSFKDLTNDDVAILLMMQHSTFDDDASVTLASGKLVSGRQMTQLIYEIQNH